MSDNALTGVERWGIAILRVAIGIVFLAHGGQKLFVWGLGGVAAFMGEVGIPAPLTAGFFLPMGFEFAMTLLAGTTAPAL